MSWHEARDAAEWASSYFEDDRGEFTADQESFDEHYADEIDGDSNIAP